MSTHWQAFWDSYRSGQAASEDDLFVQVGKTVNRRPIPREMFDQMIAGIVNKLQLGRDDHLLDLCCGNGLITFEVSGIAGRITAVDFAQHMIDAAQRLKPAPNITYRVGDALAPLGQLVDGIPTKLLMNDALAYFGQDALGRLLDNVIGHLGDRPFRFLFTGIPNDALKWNFYNTPERRARYLENQQSGLDTNDGMGRWWSAQEIGDLCERRGLRVETSDQPPAISDYRMDALIVRD